MDQLAHHTKSRSRDVAGPSFTVGRRLQPLASVAQSPFRHSRARPSAGASPSALVPLRLYVEALGAVLKMVLEGTCAFGIVGTLPDVPEDIAREHLMEVQIVPVASPSHPLGIHSTPLTISDLSAHVQLVLTDRSSLSNGTEIGVVSAKPWRLADLGAKHAFLRAGMGWEACHFTLFKPTSTPARWFSSTSSKCRKEARGSRCPPCSKRTHRLARLAAG
jgi:DNA-binding transcriptional LysR family regulator